MVLKDFKKRKDFISRVKKVLSVGVEVYVDNENSKEGLSNSTLLYILETGSPQHRLPPKPVVKPSLKRIQGDLKNEFEEMAREILGGGDRKARRRLYRIGELAVRTIKSGFGSSFLAPNAPSTIRAKGSNLPLIDTGDLRDSIKYKVKW